MKKLLFILCAALFAVAVSCEKAPTEPSRVPVTSVSLDQNEMTMGIGEYRRLTSTVSPSDATDKSVSWSSSNEAVLTVDSDGVINTIKKGMAVVTVKTTDGGYTDKCTVNVADNVTHVTGVSVAPTSCTMTPGDTRQLTATVTPATASDKSVSWSSDDEGVLTVDEKGRITAVAKGTATVTVRTTDGGLTAECAVTVTDNVIHVTGVAVSPTSCTMAPGDTKQLTATVTPTDATDKSITWSSSNEAVATVAGGTVTAVAAGSATITVTTADQGKTATCTVEVTEGTGAVTGAATHISCRNAEISGKANISGKPATSPAFGVLYSTSSGVLIGTAIQVEAKSFDSDYNFTINTEVLEPETTYYYRSYIIQDKEIIYGEVKSFKTLAVSSMIQTADATEINPKDAVLNATLDLTDCKYDGLEYGFEVTPEGGAAHTIKSTNHSQKTFSVKDETLARDTRYSFVAYVTLDGRIYKGETKSFTTTSIQASVTAESSNIGCKTATISGKLTVTSEGTFTKSAVLYYSDTANTLETLKSNGSRKTLTLGSDGSYSTDLSSLISDTKYNYVVVSKVDEVELNTGVKSFTTLKIQASVTAESSNIGCKTATISGKLTVTSEGTFTKSAVLYYSSTANTLETLKSSGMEKALTLGSDGSFCADLSFLSSDTKYYYVVVSKVDDIELNSVVKSFTTLKILASVTAESSDISYHTATISGKLTVTSEGTFTKTAALYHSGKATTIEDLKAGGTKQTITLNSDGTYSVLANGLAYNSKNYYCVVAKVDDVEFASSVNNITTKELPEVDLGLSVKWATCNLGASKPEEYGRYFAWGDVKGQTWNGSSWSGGGFSTYPEYEVDANNNLKPEYDAAHVILGGSWRMPTKVECQELIDNCTSTWTDNYNGTGVAGRIFTSNKTGYADKSIFLPAAGYGDISYLYYAGSRGGYWSSTFYYDNYAWLLYFLSGDVRTGNYYRNYGQSVRPVSE